LAKEKQFKKWKWVSEKKANVCEKCRERDGKIYDEFSIELDGKPPLHPNYKVMDKYNLSDGGMFNKFNAPFLDDAIAEGKQIRFSHDPRRDVYSLGKEWRYLKIKLNLTDLELIFEGGYWYVR
jgi:hypothetical protein